MAVEPEAYLRERAAAHADERVELRDAVATDLPVGDGEADAVVFSLVLCSVDQAAALAEARRVLRPGGELRFLEHVRPTSPVPAGGCSGCWTPPCGRGCSAAATSAGTPRRRSSEAGFTITEIERFAFPEGSAGPPAAVILGRAVRA